MRVVSVLFAVVALFHTGCCGVPQEKAITLVNAGAVDASVLKRLRAYAEVQLRVPVRAVEKPDLAGEGGLQALEKAAEQIKTDADVTLIVLSAINDSDQHLTVFAEKGIALVNVRPLYTAESEKFTLRVERQVMRAAAFAFGLESTPDPYCVTRDYRTLEDLDRMGRNFSPPWQGRFADEAAKRGLLAPAPEAPVFTK